MAFYIGDVPADALIIEPPETIDLADFTDSEARLFTPDGGNTLLSSTPDAGTDAVIVDFPNDETLFDIEGVYRLRIVLTGATGYRQGMPDVPLVVQDQFSEWHTLDSARGDWADAEHIGDMALWELLEVARNDVLSFAPALAVDVPVPVHYRKAQIMQARNILNATGVDPASGDDGAGSFVIRPFPLDWQIKQTLRPKRGLGSVA